MAVLKCNDHFGFRYHKENMNFILNVKKRRSISIPIL